MEKKTKLRMAVILGFIAVILYAKRQVDIQTVGILFSYSVLIVLPVISLIWKYKATLNKVPKGVIGLFVAASIFFWQWLHLLSFTAEIITTFVIALVALFMAFFIDFKDLGL